MDEAEEVFSLQFNETAKRKGVDMDESRVIYSHFKLIICIMLIIQ